MAAPESNSTVILATARAEVDGVLSAYKGALDRTTDKAVAATLTATIEPLERAVAALSQAVAASVGYSVRTPGTKAK
jgi:hypothetical protein